MSKRRDHRSQKSQLKPEHMKKATPPTTSGSEGEKKEGSSHKRIAKKEHISDGKKGRLLV